MHPRSRAIRDGCRRSAVSLHDNVPSSSTSASSTSAAATAGRAACRFRREGPVAIGGPNGGDGGKGGDVWLVADRNVASLLAFRDHPAPPRRQRRPRQGQGPARQARRVDLEVTVPEGTVVHDLYTGEVLADLVHHGDRWLAAAGGRGGRGNAKFLSQQAAGPELRRAGRARRGALAQARAEADGRRRPRRLPERRQEHADQRASRPPSRRSPTTRSRRSSRNLGVVRARRRHRVRRRRHPRPDRGRQRGTRARAPVPAPHRAGPGAVRPGRPRIGRRHVAGRAGADPAARARRTTGPSCSSARGSSSAPRPTRSSATTRGDRLGRCRWSPPSPAQGVAELVGRVARSCTRHAATAPEHRGVVVHPARADGRDRRAGRRAASSGSSAATSSGSSP